MPLTLQELTKDFALALQAADSKRPVWVTQKGRSYQPGIGPHPEDVAVALVLAGMRLAQPELYRQCGQHLPYPNSRQKCDLWFGNPVEWCVEVKMARFYGDNGKPDDTSLRDLLSPYPHHRSAFTDVEKLSTSSLPGRRAILIYGFDYPAMPLEPAIAAFEVLARERAKLGERASAAARGELVHPIHRRGVVHAWEVLAQ